MMETKPEVFGVYVIDNNELTGKSKYLYQLDQNCASCGWYCWADSRAEADNQAMDAGIL